MTAGSNRYPPRSLIVHDRAFDIVVSRIVSVRAKIVVGGGVVIVVVIYKLFKVVKRLVDVDIVIVVAVCVDFVLQ